MNLTIEKQELTRLLNIVGNVIDRNPVLPALSNVLLQAQDGVLVLTASNGDVSAQLSTQDKLDILEEGSILIDGATITSAIQKLDGTITISNKDNKVVIKNHLTEYSLNTASVEAYPNIDFTINEGEFTLNGNAFTQALNKVINSVAISQERPIFTGINIQGVGNELVFTSTDSYRLSKSYLETDYETDINVTILANTLKTIMKIARDTALHISTSGTRVTFRTDNTVFVTRIVDGLYPDTDRLIPQDFNTHVKVNRENLIKSVDRSSFMREDNVWILNLSAKGDILTLVTKTKEIGTTFEEVPIELQGNDIELNLNGKYLLNALQVLEDEEVVFNLVGELQALTVSDTTNQIQLLLPVRTY